MGILWSDLGKATDLFTIISTIFVASAVFILRTFVTKCLRLEWWYYNVFFKDNFWEVDGIWGGKTNNVILLLGARRAKPTSTPSSKMRRGSSTPTLTGCAGQGSTKPAPAPWPLN